MNTTKLPNHLTCIEFHLTIFILKIINLYYDYWPYIPEDNELRTLFIKEHHDTLVAGLAADVLHPSYFPENTSGQHCYMI